jgi:hypothetical protein
VYARLGKKEEARKWAVEARVLAEQHGQKEFAAAIQKELEKLR